MSSKIKINFIFQDMPSPMHRTITKHGVVQHIRNYEKNANGGVVVSPNGGHTILCLDDLCMYVSKCNYRTDKFNRKEGLKQVFTKWLDHNMYKDFEVVEIKCHQNNVMDVYCDLKTKFFDPYESTGSR